MTTTSKITYVDAINYVLSDEFNLPEEIADKLTKLRDQQAKRNTTDRKPTKTQLANENLKGVILEALSHQTEALTVSEIIKADPALNGLATQKVSPILSKLTAENKVERLVEKNRAYFRIKE